MLITEVSPGEGSNMNTRRDEILQAKEIRVVTGDEKSAMWIGRWLENK